MFFCFLVGGRGYLLEALAVWWVSQPNHEAIGAQPDRALAGKCTSERFLPFFMTKKRLFNREVLWDPFSHERVEAESDLKSGLGTLFEQIVHRTGHGWS